MFQLDSAPKLPGWLFDGRRRLRWWWIPVLAGFCVVVELVIAIPNLVFFLNGDRKIYRRWLRCFIAGNRVLINGTYEDMVEFTKRALVLGEFD